MQKAGPDTGLARPLRDIFEVDGVPAYRQFYDQGIFVWKALYRGSYAPWHTGPAPTIANPKAVRQLYRLNAVWDRNKPTQDVRLDDGTTNIDSLDAMEYALEREIPYLL